MSRCGIAFLHARSGNANIIRTAGWAKAGCTGTSTTPVKMEAPMYRPATDRKIVSDHAISRFGMNTGRVRVL
jgi:hypothetical protein